MGVMSPRIGLIARADDRGLGNMTRAFYDNLPVEKVAVVVPQASPLPQHLWWYDPAHTTVFPWTGPDVWAEDQWRAWFDGLDVIYSAETFYDWRIVRWAREAGVRTVLHAMPEYYRVPRDAVPDQVWNPTPYLPERLPPSAHVVPVPTMAHIIEPAAAPPDAGPLRVLHIADGGAHGDRNGTELVLQAMAHIPPEVDFLLTVHTPDESHAEALTTRLRSVRRSEGKWRVSSYVPDRWSLYQGQHVLMLPRRYAGLSLPVQEAATMGLAIVMTECTVAQWYPVEVRLADQQHGTLTLAGVPPIRTQIAGPATIAHCIKRMANMRSMVLAGQERARRWAVRHSWSALADGYLQALGR